MKYENIQQELNKDLEKDFEVFGRFHALVVCQGQNLCQKNNPMCSQCFLLDLCIYGQQHKTNPDIAQIQTVIAKASRKSKQQDKIT
jgi:endonuclease III